MKTPKRASKRHWKRNSRKNRKKALGSRRQWIYCLTGVGWEDVYYVGRTVHPVNRYICHLKQATSTMFNRNDVKVLWIREMIEKGQPPGIRVQRHVEMNFADEAELKEYAKRLRGGSNLVNIVPPGAPSGQQGYTKIPWFDFYTEEDDFLNLFQSAYGLGIDCEPTKLARITTRIINNEILRWRQRLRVDCAGILPPHIASLPLESFRHKDVSKRESSNHSLLSI